MYTLTETDNGQIWVFDWTIETAEENRGCSQYSWLREPFCSVDNIALAEKGLKLIEILTSMKHMQPENLSIV